MWVEHQQVWRDLGISGYGKIQILMCTFYQLKVLKFCVTDFHFGYNSRNRFQSEIMGTKKRFRKPRF